MKFSLPSTISSFQILIGTDVNRSELASVAAGIITDFVFTGGSIPLRSVLSFPRKKSLLPEFPSVAIPVPVSDFSEYSTSISVPDGLLSATFKSLLS